jgi:hypothetical protein
VARALLLVRSKPTTPQREGEYNDWYDRVHLNDVLSIPGVVAASRYRLSAGGAQMQLTDAMEMDPPPETAFFEEITPRLRSE